jgi:hypothetical protein
MKKTYILTFSSIILLAVASCSTTSLTVDLSSDVITQGAPVFFEETDLELARKGMESNIKLLEVFQRANPSNKNMRIILSELYGGFAFTFLESDLLYAKDRTCKDNLNKRIIEFYSRGLNFGLSVLRDDKDFNTALNNNDLNLLEKHSKKITNKEALFWTVFNWALLLNMNKDSVEHISELPKIKILADRMVELDKEFFYAAPLVLKGVLECSIPRMLGGNPQNGVNLMEEALQIGQRRSLISQYLYAYHCTPALQNKKLFNTLYKEIESADIEKLRTEAKDTALINSSIKLKMTELSKKISTLFIED